MEGSTVSPMTSATISNSSNDSLITIDKIGLKSSNKKRNFTTAMSQEQVKEALARIFASYYENDSLDQNAISENLSVRKLRVIVHTLKLSTVAETSVRKSYLCEVLEQFLKTDLMIVKYRRYQDEKEKSAQRRAEKRLEIEARKEQTIKKDRNIDQIPTQPIMPIRTRSYRQRNEIEVQKQTNTESDSDHNLPAIANVSDIKQDSTIQPITLDNGIRAIQVLQRYNTIIWKLSDKISELEKAISILAVRISEAEEMYGV